MVDNNKLFREIHYSNWLKLSFCKLFRTVFASDIVSSDYKYSPDEKKTKIAIYTSSPKRMEFYPQIILEAEAGRADFTFLGEQEEFEEQGYGLDAGSVNYGGSLTMPMTANIAARSTTDREHLADMTLICLRHLFRDKMEEYSTAWTKISVSGESEEMENDLPVYRTSVTWDCYSEWETKVPIALLDTISKVNLNFTVTS